MIDQNNSAYDISQNEITLSDASAHVRVRFTVFLQDVITELAQHPSLSNVPDETLASEIYNSIANNGRVTQKNVLGYVKLRRGKGSK